MKNIQSLTNPLVKEIVKLHSSKYRNNLGKFIAEGARTCSALVDAGLKPLTLLVTEETQDTGASLATPEKLFLVSKPLMKKMSLSGSPSGLLGIFAIPTPPTIAIEPGLVLAQVADPGNMGTLIRSAVAMEKKTIVIVEGADPWGPKTVQASAGAIGYATIFRLSWQELVKATPRPPLCALVVEGGSDPSNLSLANSLLVVGSEAHGIPQEWVTSCETQLTLPMQAGVGSLNAAVAGSIALYLAR